jgi:RNA polymerase sigma-70 factor (ECF subfamily)
MPLAFPPPCAHSCAHTRPNLPAWFRSGAGRAAVLHGSSRLRGLRFRRVALQPSFVVYGLPLSIVIDHLDDLVHGPEPAAPELLNDESLLAEDVHAPWPSSAPAVADEAQLQQWLFRIAEQDEAALSALYEATLPKLMGLSLRILQDPHAAEEAVEDAYWQVWRQAPRFDPARGCAMAWLLTIARSRALDALRAQQRLKADTVSTDALAELGDEWETHIDASAPAISAGTADPQDALSHAQTTTELRAALAALPALPRQLVALAFLRGLSHEEIAEQTGLALGTVKSHIRRALATLRQSLAMSCAKALAT